MATLKSRVYKILEAGHSHDWQSRAFETGMAALIILNVIAFSIETVPEIASQHRVFFAIFDFVSIIIFSLEYIARLWVCTEHPPFAGLSATRARLRYARSPFMIVDFLAIAPYYLSFIVPVDLRVLRILRLLRFFKLARFSPAFNTMLRVISAERSALMGVVIVMIGMVIIAASLLYLVEGHAQPDKFGSVPQAMWWAVATLTTVGYGDAYPITVAGKLLAGLVMVCGLGFFALPVGIIASGFMEEFRRRDFIVSWGMAASTPVFNALTPEEIAGVLAVLKSRTAPPGSVIAIDGERPGTLFMISSGAVEIRDADRPELSPLRLEEGEFWGARSLLKGMQTETATAIETCDLIVLDQDDFRILSRSQPSVHARLMQSLGEVSDPFENAERLPETEQSQ